MKSLKRFEGYYQVDHRESPGNTRAPEGTMFEEGGYVCAHQECGGAFIIIRRDRVRPRGYCPKCDRQICDKCDQALLTTGCTNLQHIFDGLMEKAIQQEALEKLRIL